MLLMGDEVRRTQKGNNNAYCQDNEISWLDWTLLDKHRDVHRFVKRLIELRLNLDVIRGNQAMTLTEFLQNAKIQWHGVALNKPDWGNSSHSLALTIRCMKGQCLFHFMLNAYWGELEFQLPRPPSTVDNGWRRVIDTYLPYPEDICEPTQAPFVNNSKYLVGPRTVAVLLYQTQEKSRK
jgi:isoamylase